MSRLEKQLTVFLFPFVCLRCELVRVLYELEIFVALIFTELSALIASLGKRLQCCRRALPNLLRPKLCMLYSEFIIRGKVKPVPIDGGGKDCSMHAAVKAACVVLVLLLRLHLRVLLRLQRSLLCLLFAVAVCTDAPP